MPIIGTDISFYQDKPNTPQGIDFAQMARVAQFTIIRAGQNLWKDTEFAESWQAAKGKLLRGSYWFYDSRADPKKQAQLYISCFPNGDMGELPLFCDFEDNYGGSFGTWKNWFDFIEELKRLAPNKKIGIYTGYYYWVERTQSATPQQLAYFAQYPLWVANYGVSNPRIPKPWATWTLWQYTDSGNGALYGAESGNIDLNYFNGDASAFAEFAKVSIVIPPTTGENTMTEYTMTPINSGTRVRRGHSVYEPLIRSVAAGVVVRGTEVWTAPADGDQVVKGDKWLKLSDGWMAYIHKGALICNNFQEVGVVVPPPPPPVVVPDEVELSFTSDKPITILNNGVALTGEYTGKITLRTKG